MKILYYFPERNTPMHQWQRTHFFDELEHHGIVIESFNPLKYSSLEQVHEMVVEKVREGQYDLFFTNQCNERLLLRQTVEEVKRLGLPTLSLRCDNLVIPFNDKELAPAFDLVWLTAKETQHLYDKWGAKTFFAPYAANPYTFSYNQPKELNKRVCFIGTPYGSRAIMINSLTMESVNADVYYKKTKTEVSLPEEDDIRLPVTEPGKFNLYYHRLLFEQGRKVLLGSLINKMRGQTKVIENTNMRAFPVVKPEDQCALYSQYVLALASTSTNHTDILKNPVKIINLRNFEIPMSGGIEICKYNPELAEYFEEGKEIVFYRDNSELVDKARYYIERATDEEILKMKQAARRRAENEHTWMTRFKLAFDFLGLK